MMRGVWLKKGWISADKRLIRGGEFYFDESEFALISESNSNSAIN